MDHRLHNIRVASPCSADWNKMTGNDQVRFCSQCNLNVYNLSEMSHREALELVSKREGRLCVRFYQRKDGTLLTDDCPRRLQVLKARISRVAGVVLSAIMSSYPLIAQGNASTPIRIAESEAGLDLTVTDASGQPCVGAKVTLTAKGNGRAIQMETSSTGGIRFSHLSSGLYHLRVDFPNFQSYESDTVVEAGKLTTVTAILNVAMMGEIVVVPRQHFFHRMFNHLWHPFTK